MAKNKDNDENDNNPLIQERSEDSVLFSLNALSKDVSSSKENTGQAQDDSSGFINLNAIAASSQFVGGAGADGKGQAQPGMVAPTMIPIGGAQQKSNTGVFVAIGIAALALIGAVVVLAVVLTQDKNEVTKEIPATAANTTAPEKDKPSGATVDKGQDKDDGDKEDDEEKPASKDDEEDEGESEEDNKAAAEAAAKEKEAKEKELAAKQAEIDKARKEHEEKMRTDPKYRKNFLEKQEKRKEKEAAAAKEREAKAAAAAKEKEAKKADPGNDKPPATKKDIPSGSIGSILDDIEGKKPKKETPAATETPKTEGEGLSRTAIKSTVGRYYGRIKSCGGGDKSGTVMVRFSIQPNGSVGSAAVTNSKKGTPEGNCVLAVVRSMNFPSFAGSAKTINFPFRLP